MDTPHCGSLAHGSNLGAGEALGAHGELGQRDVLIQRHLGRVHLEHPLALVLVQLPELDHDAEPTRREHGPVDEVQAVGRPQDHDTAELREVVELVQELAYDTVGVPPFHPTAPGRHDRVDLVEE